MYWSISYQWSLSIPYKHTMCIPRGNDRFDVVSRWNTLVVFVGHPLRKTKNFRMISGGIEKKTVQKMALQQDSKWIWDLNVSLSKKRLITLWKNKQQLQTSRRKCWYLFVQIFIFCFAEKTQKAREMVSLGIHALAKWYIQNIYWSKRFWGFNLSCVDWGSFPNWTSNIKEI